MITGSQLRQANSGIEELTRGHVVVRCTNNPTTSVHVESPRQTLYLASLTMIAPQWLRSFKSCGINNALDGTEDDAVWDDEEEEAEDAQEPIDNEFETDSEGKDDEQLSSAELSNKRFFSEPPWFFSEPTNHIQ